MIDIESLWYLRELEMAIKGNVGICGDWIVALSTGTHTLRQTVANKHLGKSRNRNTTLLKQYF